MRFVVVDIDGTLSKVGERLKYIQQDPADWDKFYDDCFEDEPIANIVELVKTLGETYSIIYCTGRRETVLDITARWLAKQGLPQGPILMRKKKDLRHDTESKPENLRKFFTFHNILPSQVAFILEDRNSMVERWRDLGFTCLQVAQGDF